MNKGSFSSEGKPPGVYVWTKPVKLNNMSLLLLKMWGVDFLNEEDEELDLINQKMMIALMSISSVCLFCGDKGSMFQSLTAIYELYRPIKERLQFEVSKFFVFVDKEATINNSSIKRQKENFNNKGFENPPTILYRGNDGISTGCEKSFKPIVGNLQNHQAFLDSHREVKEVIQTPDMINALAIILTTIADMLTTDLDFRHFIDKIPNFKRQNFREEMLSLDKMKTFSRSVLSGTALECFDQKEITSKSYKICESLFNILHTNYNTDKPIIVMPIFGNQGKGKSTLLNHIVKHLLGCSTRPHLFKMGNTGDHTTTKSQIFSHPLRIGENQLMLVDLEGLEGAETTDERKVILQKNLISAILTIASVPCILLDNDIRKIQLLEKIIEELSNLERYFGYKIERVHLLFHDKNLGADTNPTFVSEIERMNRDYFANEAVLKLQNKPNFCDESSAEDREEFLRKLMEDSNYPKKYKSGSSVLLKQLLAQMRFITEHRNTNMSEISLTDQEVQACKECVKSQSSNLHEVFKRVKGDETKRSLEQTFEAESHQFVSKCNEEWVTWNLRWTPWAVAMLETEAASYRVKIVEIQGFHEMIRDLSQFDLWYKLKDQLTNLYQNYWWICSFNNATLALKETLVKDKERYPRDLHRMDQIIEKFDKKQASLEKWYYANYGFQAVASLASGALGLAAKGAVTTVNVLRLGYGAIAAGGTGASSFFGYIVSKNLSLNGQAIELFNIKKPGWLSLRNNASTKLNSEAIKILKEENTPPIMVLLVIAAKKMKASSMLNELIRYMVLFASSTITVFDDSKLTQIIYFDYNDRKTCIVYLKMEEDKAGVEYKAVETIAVSLIQKASFTCLFMNSPEEYASDIIRKAFPSPNTVPAPQPVNPVDLRPNPEEVKQQFNPRVAAIYPEDRKDISFLVDLERREVQKVSIRVRDFNTESLQLMVADVKDAINESTPLESRTLLKVFEAAEPTANSLK